MKKLIFPLALTGAMTAAYALAETPAPTCSAMIDRSVAVAEAAAMGVPRREMMAGAQTPEDAELIDRIYNEAWPVYSARAMAQQLCQRASAR